MEGHTLEIQLENWQLMHKALICPACSVQLESPLRLLENKIICSNPDCFQSYKIINGIPRLINKSGDFLNEKELEEYAPTQKNS